MRRSKRYTPPSRKPPSRRPTSTARLEDLDYELDCFKAGCDAPASYEARVRGQDPNTGKVSAPQSIGACPNHDQELIRLLASAGANK